MAQLDYVNIRGFNIDLGINLSDVVGIAAPNLPQDVAAIQAVFPGCWRHSVSTTSTVPSMTLRSWSSYFSPLLPKPHFSYQLMISRVVAQRVEVRINIDK